ncbi:MAG: MBL fold metallo-hydrolase RNA specificity domain-containing protein [Planctomycetota bacterium]
MIRIRESGGIELDGRVWLDPEKRRPCAIVTHAHGDHIERHGLTHATPETGALMRLRLGDELEIVTHGFEEPFEVEGFTVTFFPAGHMLGSAMVLVEKDGERILFTGDVKLRANLTCPPAIVPQCDRLITECTFGLPVFRFPPAEAVRQQMIRFVEGCHVEGQSPIILAYAVGKGQEVAKGLGEAGVGVCVPTWTWEVMDLYQSFGVTFPNVVRYDGNNLEGRVLVVPPGRRYHSLIKRIEPRRIGYASGWALRKRAPFSAEIDEYFPLSDHADFDELIELIERAAPREILVTHGYKEAFARELCSRGYEARLLA